MKNPLRKRLIRDLKSNSGRYIAISLMLTVTIAMISGFLAVSDGVLEAFEENRIKCKVEDGSFTAYNEINHNTITEAEKLGASIYENYYVNEEVLGDATLRIYKNREQINLVTVIEGASPSNKDEIAIERLFAESNDISIGDTITILGTEMTITGFICVPDYSSLFENNSDLMMDSFSFGIGMVSEDVFQNFSENKISYNYSYYFHERDLTESEKRNLSDGIKECLVYNNTMLTNFCTSENNQSISFVESDMGSDVPMIKAFLFIIIGIMAFVFSIIISSTIEKESAIIGTLMASGYGKYELLRHYMEITVMVTLFSAAIGNIIGYTVTPNFFKGMYYESFSLPPMEVKLNLEALLLTTVLPIIMMVGINFVTLKRKMSITPLNFLRRDLKKKKNKKAIKLPSVSFLSWFRMRVIIQNISGYITLFVGVFLASFILMFGLCITPMINHYVDSIKKSAVSDYQYILKAPIEAENATNAEKLTAYSLETYYKPADKNIEVSFYGLAEESEYFGNLEVSDDEEGVHFSDGLAKKINAEVGDIITFVSPYEGDKYEVKVIGIYDYPAGLTVFMSQVQLNKLLGYDSEYFNGYFSDEKLKFPDENYLATVITPEDMTQLGDQMLSSFGQIAPLCLTVAIVIYLVLMYVLTKIVIDKNAIYISFMKVFGYETKEIRKLYLSATTIVVLISLQAGLPLVYLGIKGTFQISLLKLSGYIPIYIPKYLYVAIVVIGMASYFIINFIHIMRINKIEMSAALKNRE